MMAKTRLSTYISLSIILLCLTYWLHKTARPGNSYSSPLSYGSSDFQDAIREEENERRLLAESSSDEHGSSYKLLIEQDESAEQAANNQGSYAQRLNDEPDTTRHHLPTASPVPLSQSSNTSALPDGYSAAFPREIWQTSSVAGKEKYAEQMKTWLNVKGFSHHWLSDSDADQFVHDAFSVERPSLVTFWNDLSAIIDNSSTSTSLSSSSKNNSSQNATSSQIVVDSTASSAIVLRADLLRYMLMYARGGVYSDIDTSALMHPDRWIPENLGSRIINAIVGIEYDDNTYRMFVRPISFCQWALMSKPRHPIFLRAIDRVVSNLEFLARRQRVDSLSQLKLDKLDVLEATGPGMISDVVLEVIRDQLPDEKIDWQTFHNQKEGKLFGDVLILPINGFAGNQKHSHAGDPEYGEKLVQHHFGRSWYSPKKAFPV